MKISVVQTSITWENKKINLNRIEGKILPLRNFTDIVVLPEMFNTGFSMDTSKTAEPENGETFQWMLHMARKGNYGICGSYTVKEDKNIYNRFVFVSPNGESCYYNKRHLFSMADENKNFTRGEKRLFFEFKGFRICPLICYDLRFPVWSRNNNEFDLLIYSANWPESRRDVWNILLKARAIENQSYVAGSNITGENINGINYSGDSTIIDPYGKQISSLEQYHEGVLTSGISIDDLINFRLKFPVLKDADDFNLKT
jgi:omega-amidase